MTISYLITLYNKEEFIGGTLDSVLAEHAQTGGEIIIYNDVSTDRSMEIARERMAAHPAQAAAVRFMGEAANRGVSFATNRLIEAAGQPYTRLIDADDLLVPGSTVQLLRLLQKNNLGFIFGRYISRLENPGDQSYAECVVMREPVEVVLRHLAATPSSSLFATDKLKKVLPLPEQVRRTQDFSIFLRLACRGVAIGSVHDVVSLLPPVYTANNLSSGSAAAYAEICRTVAGEAMPLHNLRSASRRYAGRATKYFRRDGQSRLTGGEKFHLWLWRHLAWMAPTQTCIERLGKTADLFDRDRHVIKGLRKS